MRLTTNSPTPKKKTLSLIERLERMRTTLSTAENVWAEILDIPAGDYSEFRHGRKDLSIVSLARLADHFELTLESIMSGQIDYRVLAARQGGDRASLPERYQTGAASRKRSSMNLLNATEDLLGWQVRAMAMRHLQVTEATFSNLDDVINLRFNTDLCDYLGKHYGGDHLFYQMGAFSIISNMNSNIFEVLAKNRSLKNLYPHYIEDIIANHWEKNFRYRILKVTDTFCRAEGIPNPDVAASLKVRNPGSAAICQTKVGIVASTPGYLGLPFAHVEEVNCVHRGDAKCVYEMDFEVAARHHAHGKNTGESWMAS